ncbi:hypothetical protein P7K49_015879 [Saguinus oedipus]|uniref:KHDRBS Qua1 domain-containing protein n=1 Tax=Saguinus oedipus TaxID=9490 RepID=A0ABQ9VBA4_SAGOE|nr:hypothetical protein P7K49_015879 [Saguinus oedipus]
MQRRDDPAARMSRSSGRSGSMDPSGAHPSVRQTPSRQPPLPHRSRGGGGGSRGGARASPATQPPPLLPPSATGPDATVGGPAPTPLLPPSATASVKMEPENKYLPELMAEKDSLDPSFTHAMQLLTAGKGASRVPLGRPAIPGHEWPWLCSSRFPPPSGPRKSGAPVSSSFLGPWSPHSHLSLECEGEFLGCSAGPKATLRSPSANVLMDSAELPAPFPTLLSSLLLRLPRAPSAQILPEMNLYLPLSPKGKPFGSRVAMSASTEVWEVKTARAGEGPWEERPR